MPRAAFNLRVFSSYVPKSVLNSIRGEIPVKLLERMRRHKLDILGLSDKTGLHLSKVQAIVYGEKLPISERGSWTKEAISIARVLLTEPEEIFGDILDEIHLALSKPSRELLPSVLAPEIHSQLTGANYRGYLFTI